MKNPPPTIDLSDPAADVGQFSADVDKWVNSLSDTDLLFWRMKSEKNQITSEPRVGLIFKTHLLMRRRDTEDTDNLKNLLLKAFHDK